MQLGQSLHDCATARHHGLFQPSYTCMSRHVVPVVKDGPIHNRIRVSMIGSRPAGLSHAFFRTRFSVDE